jgi:hypothetical protein
MVAQAGALAVIDVHVEADHGLWCSPLRTNEPKLMVLMLLVQEEVVCTPFRPPVD